MTTARTPTDADLDRMQWIADPHADRAIDGIVGDWPLREAGGVLAESAAAATADEDTTKRLDRIKAVNKAIHEWDTNQSVRQWAGSQALRDVGLEGQVREYLAVACTEPKWVEHDRIRRAEKIFMDEGVLSVLVLFCSSLPECYVVPDLAAVLHATGQLEDRAEHRIRATGAMIFPAMMRGGLTTDEGGGIAQILKVRLIHAMVRNLILRDKPEDVVKAGVKVIPPLANVVKGDRMFETLFVHGWDVGQCGLPNNQEELAYTLLTFNYVFLRSMRRLGLGLGDEGERDYIHLWNLAGHYLGIERDLMVDTYDEAAALFARMQARGRQDMVVRPLPVDPRPRLGNALMEAMQSVIPPGPLKPFPVLMTRMLVEPKSAVDLGIEGRVSGLSSFLFGLLMLLTRGIDTIGRVFSPGFSLSRMLARILGYHLTCKLMMGETRQLLVPDTLKPGIHALVKAWSDDSKSPGWVNAIEDHYTTDGAWQPTSHRAQP